MTVGGDLACSSRLWPQPLHKLLVDDVNDLLHGGEAGEHLRSQRPLLHPLDERADDLEVDVGLQERQAHFAQGFVKVLLVDRAVAAEAAEDALKLIGKGFEHSYG